MAFDSLISSSSSLLVVSESYDTYVYIRADVGYPKQNYRRQVTTA